MIYSSSTEYAIRALTYLARKPEGTAVPIKEVAEKEDLPPHFLAKIMQTLAKQGLLHSYKGRGGGFSLARPASDITLLEVIQAIEGPRFGEGCFLGLDECTEEGPCALHHEWGRIRQELFDVLGGNTVQELLDESPGLQLDRAGT